MRKAIQTVAATSLILYASQLTFAAECSARSGANIVPLLELYTSEGCSSCPPADKWMSAIKSSQKANQVTPLAFHVDYWDYLGGKDKGWKDQFSKVSYSERQRKIAALGGAGFVYTPQFTLNGRDFRGWDNSRLHSAIAKSEVMPSRANLYMETAQENGRLTLKASAQAINKIDITHADIFVAIYENKLVTQVKAGENAGRELKHDYVVRELFGAYQLNQLNQFSKHFNLLSDWKNREGGAVIFVQDARNGEILQSLQMSFMCN